MHKIRIYIVEDEALIAMEICDRLMALNYEIGGQAAQGEIALEEIPVIHPDLVLMDIKLAGALTGIETVKRLRSQLDLPVIYLTAFSHDPLLTEAIAAEPYGYLVKPFEERELHATIQAVYYKHQAERLLRDTNRTLEAAVQQRTVELQESKTRLQELNETLDCLVTERTDKWRESDERYRLMVANLRDYAIIFLDDKGLIVDWNVSAENCTGYQAKEIIGKHFTCLYPPEKLTPETSAVILATAKKGGRTEYESRQIRKDGCWYWANIVITALRDAAGILLGYCKIIHNIAATKQAELQLLNSQKQFINLFEFAPDAMVITNAKGLMVQVNQQTEKLFDYVRTDLIEQPIEKLMPDFSVYGDVALWQQFLCANTARVMGTHKSQLFGLKKDGAKFPIDVKFSPLESDQGIRMIAAIRDITEQERLQQQLLRAQRLESMGTLAGGLAHDLNNAITPIMMATSLLRLQFPNGSSHIFDMIDASAKRGAGMVKKLLTYVKGTGNEYLPLKTQNLFKDIEQIIIGTFPKNIQLKSSIPRNLWIISGDATQLYQVLLNLCVNARDAMPEGGILTLMAENMDMNTSSANTIPDLRPGLYVVWRITDTGSGMPPEILEHIFEPFFSTKGPEKGTGLGLSTVFGIIKNHQGCIQVQSIPGQGSTFTIYLPSDGSHVVTGESTVMINPKAIRRGRGETILVVDDEQFMREMLRDTLWEQNFQVVTAATGTEGLLRVIENWEDLRVVITDLHMPVMNGLALTRILRELIPTLVIIVISGFLEEHDLNEFKKLGVTAFLNKPFNQNDLASILHQELRR